MKTSCLMFSVLGALLLVAVAKGQTPKEFQQGREYFFNYNGYSLSGRPDSSQFSGFKLNAYVCLSVVKKIRGGYHMQLRFEKARLDLVNGDISPFRPERGDSPKLLTKGLKKIKAKFDGFVHFNWRYGEISGIRKQQNEAEEVSNLKKGALAMLNFDLSSLNSKNATMVDWKYEQGMEGNCKTAYVVMENKKNKITLERIRNLYACTNSSLPIGSVHRFIQGQACSKGGSIRGTPLTGDSRTILKITKRSSSKFFLRSANTISQYVLPKTQRPELQVGSYITQELTFDRIGVKPVLSRKKLQATPFQPVTTVTRPESKSLRKDVDTYLAKMKKSGNSVDFNVATRDLISTLRLSSVADLLYALKKADSSSSRVKNAVYDVIGNVGTNEAQKVILDMVKSSKTSDTRASSMLRLLAFSTFYPSKLEDTLMKLSNTQRLMKKDRVETLQVVWMMVGVLHCRLERRNDPQVAKWFRNQYRKKHTSMDKSTKITTLLMGMGNAGAERSLSDILYMIPVVRRQGLLTLHTRLHIVHAMRKYAPRPKLQSNIRTIVWPMFANYKEDSEVRIAAFQLLMKTNPQRRHMSILMSQLRKEPCRHVRNFVVSHLHLIAKFGRSSPCRAKIANRVRWALPSLYYRWNPCLFESGMRFFPVSKSTAIVVSIIYCSHSALPRSITIEHLFVNEQVEVSVWSATIRSEESGEILRNLAGADGSITDRLKTLFKEFRGKKKRKTTGAQTTVHYSVSGEDAGYYGSTFLGSKSNPIKVIQTLLQFGISDVFKTGYVDLGAHLPTSFGTTLNWNQNLITHQQMYFKIQKKQQMTYNVGQTVVSETSLGFSYALFCGHTMERQYYSIHPGQPHKTTMSMTTSRDKKKMSFSVHTMPHKDVMEFARSGKQYYQVIRDGRSTAKYYPMYKLTTSSKATRYMGFFKMTTTGLTKDKFNRISRRGELSSFVPMTVLSKSYKMVLQRFSKYCGMQLNVEIKTPPGEAAPPRTTRIAALKVNLARMSKSGKIRGSPERPYVRPLGLQQFAKAEAKVKISFYKMRKGKRTEVKAGVATVRVGASGDTLDISFRPRMGNTIQVSYNRRIIGARPFYDINNPFTITANSGSEGTLRFLMNKKTVAKVTRKSEVSKYWVDEWKRILKNPSVIAYTWPDIYHCYNDVKSGFFGTPCCYRAWRQLQTFDTVSSVASGPDMSMIPMMQQQIASVVSQLYTYSRREKVMKADGTLESKVSASFCPLDLRAVDNNRNYYARVLDGFPTLATCSVSFFDKQRKFYVRTFDGLNYAGNMPGRSAKGQAFVLLRDCKRNQIRVGLGTTKKGTRYVLVYATIGGRACKATAYRKSKSKFSLKGNCKKVKSGKAGQISYVDLRSLGVKVLLTGKTEVSIQVSRAMYMNSLHGICGNFDREPEHMELLGCKKGAVTYFSNTKSGWDAMIRNYMTKGSISKFKGCL